MTNSAILRNCNGFFRKYPGYRLTIFAGSYSISPTELKIERRCRSRTANFELRYLLQGNAELTMTGTAVTMTGGDAVLLTPNLVCKTECLADAVFLILRFELSENKKPPLDILSALPRRHYRVPGLREHAERIVMFGRRRSGYLDHLLRYLVMELIFELLDRVAPVSAAHPEDIVTMHYLRGEDPDRVVEAAQSFIYDNFHRKLLPREVSDHIGITLNHLNHIIKNKRNCTVLTLIWQSRLFWAANRLYAGDEPVKDVARGSGIEDFNYFCHRFKQLTGCTPLEYRIRSRKGEIALFGAKK